MLRTARILLYRLLTPRSCSFKCSRKTVRKINDISVVAICPTYPKVIFLVADLTLLNYTILPFSSIRIQPFQ